MALPIRRNAGAIKPYAAERPRIQPKAAEHGEEKVKAMDGWDATGHNRLDLAAYRLSRTTDMIHSELRALYNYWNRLRAGGRAPMRSDIDPRDMSCDARNLFILENHGQRDIRFRLAGTTIIDAFGVEFRGLDAREIMAPASRESFAALIAEVLEDPGIGYARLSEAADQEVIWEINLLPLKSSPGHIDRAIGCLHLLSGISKWQRESPLRFLIDYMSVDPVEEASQSRQGGSGFAEAAEPFSSTTERRDRLPHLTAISGDAPQSDDPASDKAARPRDHLRLVKR